MSRTLAAIAILVALTTTVAIMVGLWDIAAELEQRQTIILAGQLELALARAAGTYPVDFNPLFDLREELQAGDRDDLEARLSAALPDYSDFEKTVHRYLQGSCPGLESRATVKIVRVTLLEEDLHVIRRPSLGSVTDKRGGYVSAEHSLFLDASGLSVEVFFEAAGVNVDELLGSRRRSLRLGAVTLAVLFAVALGVTLRAVHYSRTVGAYQNELIDTLAHELHTPLTTLHVGLKTLSPDLDGDGAEVAERMQNQIHRLQRLTERVTASSRALLHSAPPDLTVRSLDKEIESLLAERFPESLESGTLQLQLDAPGTGILADRSDLEVLVGNLVENALKYGVMPSQADEQIARVVVSTAVERKHLVVRIDDNGPGLRRDIGRHVFRPFGRGGHATSGLGLGLFLCRRIARRMGGRLTVGPSDLGGFCARVRIPHFHGGSE